MGWEKMTAPLWNDILEKLKEALPTHTYSSFVQTIQCEEAEPENLNLKFQDSFSKEYFQEKCEPFFKRALEELKKDQIKYSYSILQKQQEDFSYYNLQAQNPFDSKYTFETFVVGSSNQFAHAACQAVAKQPGQCYNPLFIFGGAGLGKTHLLKAIGHQICKENDKAKVLFLTSESFTNELIQAIRTDRMREFKEKYRTGCDVLLLDDIHFLVGKDRTQEEFFYTFNYLHESRKQIVITSDRYPRDIEGLEKRLQTRFEWGLVADVQPPETETRIAILKNKAEDQHLNLPDDVATYIASHITTNIRELEGSLHRLAAFSSLTNQTVSLDLAQQVMKDIAPKTRHQNTPESILNVVALQFSVRGSDLKSEKRVRKLSLPRQICMYLLRRHLSMSFPDIGKFMGGKDHSTVMHGVSKIAEAMRTDPEIMNYVTTLEGILSK